MTTTDDVRRRLEAEIGSLKSQMEQLEKNQMSHEDRLSLETLRRMPFTIWACDRNFRIVLWNSVCAQVYGIGAKEAIGAEYADLFVDPVEQEQSREDVCKIIDDDVTFKNFLAYDHSAERERRTMLTNCFRIWDSRLNEYLQAEVALEISDLQLRIDEHRTLREVGIARLEQRKKVSDLRKSELLSRLTAICHAGLRAVEREQDRLAEFREKLVVQNVDLERIKALTITRQQQTDTERKRIESKHREITSKIIPVFTIEELDMIDAEITQFAEETPGNL